MEKLNEILKVGDQVFLRRGHWKTTTLQVYKIKNITKGRGDITLEGCPVVFDCYGKGKSKQKYQTSWENIEAFSNANKQEYQRQKKISELYRVWTIPEDLNLLTNEEIELLLPIMKTVDERINKSKYEESGDES